MANPFFKGGSALNGNMSQAKNIYNMLKQSNNPNQLITQMLSSNPQMRPIMNMLNQGNNPEQLFRNLCQQRGINPDEFIRSLTS